jgi:uncharacterized protein
MKISGEQILSAPREAVWHLFNDPERLSRLVPGCEKLEVVAPDEFAGTVNVGVAAVKGIYSGKLKIEDKRAPEHYRMVVDGKGKQGFVRGSGTIDLVPNGAHGIETIVRYAGDVQLGGPIVQVGQRVIDSAAKMMLGQFFAAADAELKAHAQGRIARQGIFLNFFRWIARIIRSIFRQKWQ